MESGERTPLILAIDTSSEQAGIGLFGDGVAAELLWRAGRTQTVALLGQIHHLLGLHGLGPGDLGAIAVATGPGTFNGLRVGMSVSKGLVLALDLPIVGVGTLEIAAAPVAETGRAVLPMVAAGRGRIVWACFDAGLPLRQHATPRNTAAPDLLAWLQASSQNVVVTGEIPADAEPALRSLPNVTVVDRWLRARRPAALASLAAARLASGDTDDAVLLEPGYLGR